LELIHGILQLLPLFRREVFNVDIHDIPDVRHLGFRLLSHWACQSVLTQNPHLAPSTQQAEQAGFTREEITRRASQFFPEN
jgi:hypothetical protein